MNPKDAALASISQKLGELQNEFDTFLGQQAQSNEVEYNGDDTMDMVQPAPGVETANTMVSTTNQPASCAGCYETDDMDADDMDAKMETTTLEDGEDMDTDDTAPIAPENTEEVPPMADDAAPVEGGEDMNTDVTAPIAPENTEEVPPVEEDEDMDDTVPMSTEEPAMPEDDDSSVDVTSDVDADADVTPEASTDVDAEVDATPEADVDAETIPDISAISTEELQAELDRRESEPTDDSAEGAGPEETPKHEAGETEGHEAAETDEEEAAEKVEGEEKSEDSEVKEEEYSY